MFNSILIVLFLTVAISMLFHRLRMPAIVGYIVIGMLLGPNSLGWVHDLETIKELAEFGIVFLMFAIGLEFSLAQLLAMKTSVFFYGGLQVLFTMSFTILIGVTLPMNWQEAIVIGGIVAMSSTAIVMKQLTEQLETNLPHSIDAFAILLFQDMAVIPLLILIPSIANTNASVSSDLLLALVKSVVAITLLLFFARKVLRPLLFKITETGSLELFTLTILLVTLSAAWLTHRFGLSMALGAFLAGMMLAETEFRHQIETDIRPFRDVLLGFFFITIGMQFDFHTVYYSWKWMLLLLITLLFFKSLLITCLGFVLKRDIVTASRTGMILAHGGEFGFALLTVALAYRLIPPDYSQTILASLLLSMIIAPFFIRYNKKFVTYLFPDRTKLNEEEIIDRLSDMTKHLRDHVIICGYGRVGQNIARLLEKVNLSYLALDLDSNRVASASIAGDPICYADATQYEILKHANIEHAKALVISFSGAHAAVKILEQTRKFHKHLPIIIRSYDDSETELFYKKGATEVIAETLEASLILASHILLLMNIPVKKVEQLMLESRLNQYDLLRMVFPGNESPIFEEPETSKQGLRAITLTENAYANKKTIASFELEKQDVQITKVLRKGQQFIDPKPQFQFENGDVVVMYGEFTQLDLVEDLLFGG